MPAAGMAAAALAEIKRLSVAKANGTMTTYLPIQAFLLISQFFWWVPEKDLYTLVSQISSSPSRLKGMKTMSTGLFLSTLSLGFFFSSLLVSIVKAVTGTRGRQGWVGENINNGRLDCFYGLLAALSIINFVLFLISASWYKRRTIKHVPQMEIIVKRLSAEED